MHGSVTPRENRETNSPDWNDVSCAGFRVSLDGYDVECVSYASV